MHVYGKNMGDKGNGNTEYSYEYYEPETGFLRTGCVMHNREERIRSLIISILEDVTKHK